MSPRAESESSPHAIGISGVYTVAEVRYLTETLGAVLIYIDADPEERFARLRRRADGLRDHMSREDFNQAEIRESSGATDDDANLQRVRELAKYELNDDGSLDEESEAPG